MADGSNSSNRSSRTPKPTHAERTAAEWIRPGGGYEQYRKGDAERERRLSVGGRYTGDYGRKTGLRKPKRTTGRSGARR